MKQMRAEVFETFEKAGDEISSLHPSSNEIEVRGDVTQSSVSILVVHGLMILSAMFVASSFPVGKQVADALPADVMMLIRFALAACLFAPYVWYRYGFRLPNRKRLMNYALLSIPLVTFFWCMFEALKYTSAMNTGAMYTMVPAMTAIFALIINGEQTGRRLSIGLALGAVGALWVIFRGDLGSLLALDVNMGDKIFFFGALALSLYGPLVKRLHSGEPLELMTFWIILFGAFWLLLASSPKLGDVNWQGVPLEVFGALLYLAVFTTLLSFFLLQFGTVRIGPTKVAAYGLLNPVFVLVISVAMGQEDFMLVLIPGMVLVIVAMLLVQVGE